MGGAWRSGSPIERAHGCFFRANETTIQYIAVLACSVTQTWQKNWFCCELQVAPVQLQVTNRQQNSRKLNMQFMNQQQNSWKLTVQSAKRESIYIYTYIFTYIHIYTYIHHSTTYRYLHRHMYINMYIFIYKFLYI